MLCRSALDPSDHVGVWMKCERGEALRVVSKAANAIGHCCAARRPRRDVREARTSCGFGNWRNNIALPTLDKLANLPTKSINSI